jgi:hypothetical protein
MRPLVRLRTCHHAATAAAKTSTVAVLQFSSNDTLDHPEHVRSECTIRPYKIEHEDEAQASASIAARLALR